MITILLATVLALPAAAPAAPATPATPAVAPAAPEPPGATLPADVRALVQAARALRSALGDMPVSPAPVVDGPEQPPVWIESVMPVGMIGRRDVRSETTLTVPRNSSLELRTFAGQIAVQAWNRNTVRVVAEHGRRDRLVPRFENGALVVEVSDRLGQPAFGVVTVQVPAWLPVRVSSVESPIDVEGLRAAVEAGSIRGNVIARRVHGPLQLRSVEGLVRVQDARGPVSVASINNVIQLVRVLGQIDAESVNGDIDLADVESPDVEASSVNGSVQFAGPFQPRGRYRLASHSGNLRVGVPVGSDVDVSVRNFRGAFQSGIPLQVGPHGPGRRITFTLGGGGSTLELESFQGLIQLLRSNELPAPPPPPQRPAPQGEDR